MRRFLCMLSGTVFLMQVMLPGQYYQRVFAKSCWKSLRVLRTPKARPGAGCSSRFTERNCGEGFGEEAGNEWCAHWPYTLPLEAFKHAQSNNCPALIKTLATRLKRCAASRRMDPNILLLQQLHRNESCKMPCERNSSMEARG